MEIRKKISSSTRTKKAQKTGEGRGNDYRVLGGLILEFSQRIRLVKGKVKMEKKGGVESGLVSPDILGFRYIIMRRMRA